MPWGYKKTYQSLQSASQVQKFATLNVNGPKVWDQTGIYFYNWIIIIIIINMYVHKKTILLKK